MHPAGPAPMPCHAYSLGHSFTNAVFMSVHFSSNWVAIKCFKEVTYYMIYHYVIRICNSHAFLFVFQASELREKFDANKHVVCFFFSFFLN